MTISETIARLRELEAKATQGPWNATSDAVFIDHPHLTPLIATIETVNFHADAQFIALLRNSLPELLEHIERLQRAVYCPECGNVNYTPEVTGAMCRCGGGE